MLSLHLTDDCISAFPLPRILLVLLPSIYYLHGYWPISILLNQYKWQVFIVYKRRALSHSTPGIQAMISLHPHCYVVFLPLSLFMCICQCEHLHMFTLQILEILKTWAFGFETWLKLLHGIDKPSFNKSISVNKLCKDYIDKLSFI